MFYRDFAALVRDFWKLITLILIVAPGSLVCLRPLSYAVSDHLHEGEWANQYEHHPPEEVNVP